MGTGAVFIAIVALLVSLFGLSIVIGAILNIWWRDAERKRNVLDKWD